MFVKTAGFSRNTAKLTFDLSLSCWSRVTIVFAGKVEIWTQFPPWPSPHWNSEWLLLGQCSWCISKFILSFQNHLFWENGSPVAYQEFHNANFGKVDVTLFSCKTIFWHTGNLCVDLTGLKTSAQSELYPYRTVNNSCILMLLSNVAEPDWIQVNCNTPFLSDVLCLTIDDEGQTNLSSEITKDKITTCLQSEFLQESACLLFVWLQPLDLNRADLSTICQHSKSIFTTSTPISKFQFLFDAVTSEFPPFISQD